MVALTHVPELAEFPQELIAAFQAQAIQDADAVGVFLRESGLHPVVQRPDGPIEFPLEYLIGIGLGLRFLRCEQAKVAVHTAAGLPTAAELFKRVGTLLRGPILNEFVTNVWSVWAFVFYASFLWLVDDGDPRFELSIVTSDNEPLLDAVVDYLWAQIQCSFVREEHPHETDG